MDPHIISHFVSKSNTLVLKLTLIVTYYLSKHLKNVPHPTPSLSYQKFLLPLIRTSDIHIVFILFYVLCPNEVLVPYLDLCPRQITWLSYLYLFWSLGNFQVLKTIFVKKKISTLWSKINYVISNRMFLVHTKSIPVLWGKWEFSGHLKKYLMIKNDGGENQFNSEYQFIASFNNCRPTWHIFFSSLIVTISVFIILLWHLNFWTWTVNNVNVTCKW